jgi:hypothetical protein
MSTSLFPISDEMDVGAPDRLNTYISRRPEGRLMGVSGYTVGSK